jgi:hypothetical protein
MLDDHPMLRAVNPPGGIEKPCHNPPQGWKEKPALRQPVITRSGLETAGTLGRDGRVRLDGDFDTTGLAIAMAVEADVSENESGKTLNHVQNGLNLQLNSWSPVRGWRCFATCTLLELPGISYLVLPPWTSSRRLWAGAASGGGVWRTPVSAPAGRDA